MVITLYSIEQIKALLPKDTKIGEDQLQALIVKHGTYRQLGKSVILTEGDFRDFLACIAAKRTKKLAPSPNEAGLMVFIGNPDVTAHVMVGWCPIGQELELREHVQEFAQERVLVLGTCNATPADVNAFRKSMSKLCEYGYWFSRTKDDNVFARAMKYKIDAYMDDDEEEEQVERQAEGLVGKAG